MKGGRNNMNNKQEVEKITNELYGAYGSDTGYLFGLEPKHRNVVQAIVEFTLDHNKEEEREECSVCHGRGFTTDHHDPCSECGGSGYYD